MSAGMIYSIISYGNEKVLCEANFQSGNYPQLIQKVLKEKNPQNTKVIYQLSDYLVHVYNDGLCTYLVLADPNFQRRQCFAFLNDIQLQFREKFNELQIKGAFAYSLQNQFGDLLKSRMKYFSETKDNLGNLIDKLEDTKQIMVDNVGKILERGEKIEVLVQKTQDMSGMASNLKSRAGQLKNKKRWENYRTKIILFLLFLILIYVIIGFACGFGFQCFSK